MSLATPTLAAAVCAGPPSTPGADAPPKIHFTPTSPPKFRVPPPKTSDQILASEGLVGSKREADAAREAGQLWAVSLDLEGELEGWLVREAAAASLRLERDAKIEAGLRDQVAARAADIECWGFDRIAEAEEIAAKLHLNPPLVRARLWTLHHGCEVIARRWIALNAVLKAGGAWDEAQRSLAMDLLGTPRATRAGADPLRIKGLEGEALRARCIELAQAEFLIASTRMRTVTLKHEMNARAVAMAGEPAAADARLKAVRRRQGADRSTIKWALREQKSIGKARRKADADHEAIMRPLSMKPEPRQPRQPRLTEADLDAVDADFESVLEAVDGPSAERSHGPPRRPPLPRQQPLNRKARLAAAARERRA